MIDKQKDNLTLGSLINIKNWIK